MPRFKGVAQARNQLLEIAKAKARSPDIRPAKEQANLQIGELERRPKNK